MITTPCQSCLPGGGKNSSFSYIFFGSRVGVQQTDIDSLMNASAVLEMVHVATLVHDDILDYASTRSNYCTILLATIVQFYWEMLSYALAAEFPTAEVCKIVARATKRHVLVKSDRLFGGKFEIGAVSGFINDKTGELFKASWELVACLQMKMWRSPYSWGIGSSLGINQVFDDLIDGNSTQSSKTLRSDWSTGNNFTPYSSISSGESNGDLFKIKIQPN